MCDLSFFFFRTSSGATLMSLCSTLSLSFSWVLKNFSQRGQLSPEESKFDLLSSPHKQSASVSTVSHGCRIASLALCVNLSESLCDDEWSTDSKMLMLVDLFCLLGILLEDKTLIFFLPVWWLQTLKWWDVVTTIQNLLDGTNMEETSGRGKEEGTSCCKRPIKRCLSTLDRYWIH